MASKGLTGGQVAGVVIGVLLAVAVLAAVVLAVLHHKGVVKIPRKGPKQGSTLELSPGIY